MALSMGIRGSLLDSVPITTTVPRPSSTSFSMLLQYMAVPVEFAVIMELKTSGLPAGWKRTEGGVEDLIFGEGKQIF
jgi:hypothetical protein